MAMAKDMTKEIVRVSHLRALGRGRMPRAVGDQG
jgi:hypothetical protein